MSATALRLQLLAARRERLVLRAAEQRTQLGQAAAPLAPTWRRIELGLLVWRSVRQHPWLVALPVAVVALWRPRAARRALAAAPWLWRLGAAWSPRP